MTRYDAGDVVLVKYPFTDLSATKQRPAVVLSPFEYSNRLGDAVLMPLTSQAEADMRLAIMQW